MDFAISERQQELINNAREVYERKLKPFCDNNDVHSGACHHVRSVVHRP